MSRARDVARALLVALAALAALAGLRTPSAGAGDLSADEQKWVRTLLDSLGANSGTVRRGAEQALAAMGVDALPEIVEALPLKSEAARKGLFRALRAMGVPKVRSKLDRMRDGARGTASKRIEELLADLGAELSPDQAFVVALRTSVELTPERAPLRVERVLSALDAALPPPFAARRLAVKATSDALLLDADGDGTLETKVGPAEARVVTLPAGPASAPRPSPALLYRKGDRWYVCPASLLRGSRGKVAFEFLDADLDGEFDGPADERRVGDGAFGPNGEVRTLGLDEGLVTYALAKEGKESDLPTLRLLGVRRPDGLDDDAWDGLVGLSQMRMRLGLAAPGIDAAKCRGCKKHCEYLVQNAGSAAIEGLLAHGEKPELPGYSAEGAAAGGSSGLAPTGDAIDGARMLMPTLLHRSALLAPATTEYGIGCARGRGGWTAVWGGGVGVPGVEPNAAPLVVPAPGQTGVPTTGSGEVPDPDEPKGYYSRPRGYPVAAYFSGGVPKATLQLFEAGVAGAPAVPAHVWTPTNPVSSRAGNDGAILLMPDAPLARSTAYRAELTIEDGRGTRFVWIFTTM